jgi:hypothetical protein
MKINGIKPYLAQMISSDKSSINTKHQYRPDYAEEVVERDERYIIDHYLYTEEQVLEFAKAQVYEALYKHTSFGTGKEELVKHMTDEFFAEKILEDMKND